MFEEYLKKALLEQKLPNTLLFAGEESHGKKTALWLAAALLKTQHPETHPDFYPLIPDGKLHSIDSIRSAIDNSHQSPFQAPVKFFLIESAECMQPAAANALLKTLEEPLLDSYWVLLSVKPQEILPTILSRCTRLFLHASETLPPEFEEAAKILQTILAERPSYPKLFLALEQIGEVLEGKDPNPLFDVIASHFLDLERKRGSNRWQEPLEQAKLGLDRNIKLSTCLENFFLSIY